MNQEISLADAHLFEQLFKGNSTHFGQFTPDNTQEEIKVKGKAETVRRPLGIESYLSHLRGEIGLGIVPIYDSELVNFSVIDVDSYAPQDTQTILGMVHEYGLPFVPFRSKSGGLHLYIFYEHPTRAAESVALLKEFLVIFHLPKKTEIFPKQTVLKGEGIGNWINLPYFGGDDTSRYLITKEGTKPAFYQAMLMVGQRRYTIEQARDVLRVLPLSDGPPCLQHIIMQGAVAPGAGNNFFFSLGRYWKIKDESELETKLQETNANLEKPMDTHALNATINSVKKTDASFLCNQDPLLSLCNRAICGMRKFGIEHVDVSNFSFGGLTKYEADPPYYIWEVDGAKLEFYSEESLLNQREFQKLSVRHLHKAPKILKEYAWIKIINNALANMRIVKIELEEDFSLGAMFMENLTEFLEYRNPAYERSQVIQGAVFKDVAENKYYFKKEKLYTFFTSTKGFRAYSPTEIQNRLRQLGGGPERLYVGKEQGQERCWQLPMNVIAPYLKGAVKEVDFLAATADQIGGDF